MTLKCRTETVYVVEVNDLEEFIKEQTGHSYEIVPNEQWGNDQQHRLVVEPEMQEWDIETWDNFKASGKQYHYCLRAILDGLCADGKLPAGTYVIDVSW